MYAQPVEFANASSWFPEFKFLLDYLNSKKCLYAQITKW